MARRAALVLPILAALTAGPIAAAPAEARTPRIALERGPQVYRLDPIEDQEYGDLGLSRYLYAIVYRQSRVVYGSTFDDDEGGGLTGGTVSVHRVFAVESTAYALYGGAYAPQHCVVAYVSKDETTAVERRRLDRVRVGRRVRVTIQPLEKTQPHARFGRTFHRTAVMRSGSRYTLLEPSVQRQLRRIGCDRRGRVAD